MNAGLCLDLSTVTSGSLAVVYNGDYVATFGRWAVVNSTRQPLEINTKTFTNGSSNEVIRLRGPAGSRNTFSGKFVRTRSSDQPFFRIEENGHNLIVNNTVIVNNGSGALGAGAIYWPNGSNGCRLYVYGHLTTTEPTNYVNQSQASAPQTIIPTNAAIYVGAIV